MLRIAFAALMSAPARIGLAVAGTFVILIVILFAVRPDMMMDLVHGVMAAR